MSSLLLRTITKFGPALSWADDDTLRRVAYVAPRGVALGDWFALPDDWGRGLPIFGGLPALSPRSMRRRLQSATVAGVLEVSGRLARVKFPGQEAMVAVTKRAKRAASAVWLAARSSVASVSDWLAAARSGRGQKAAPSGHGCGLSDGDVIDNSLVSADSGQNPALAGGFVASGDDRETGYLGSDLEYPGPKGGVDDRPVKFDSNAIMRDAGFQPHKGCR